ncbi:MAG: DNA polymerase III subunit beta [Bacteroidales bacterium]|nr:DNA polymerase III subunit beta [Bacteroidales bacterium]
MKFIISSLKLQKAIVSLSGVLNSNNALPILDDFLFEMSDGILKVTACNLETRMTVTIKPEMMDGTFSVTIPARFFIDLMKSLPDIPVSITIDENTLGIEVSTGEGRYKMVGHKSEEYPKEQPLDNPVKWEIPADVIACGFDKTISATANDEDRPIMNGVLMDMTNEMLTFVATDAHKLVRYRRVDVKSENGASFVIPKKPIGQLKNSLANKADEMVTVEFDKKNAKFTFDDFSLQCRLIDGTYPKYNSVIPQESPNKLIVDRMSLVSAMKRVSIFSSKATSQIRFKITGQELILTAEDLDYYNEAKERLTCNYTGNDMEIGFNSRFFQEMLANVSQQEVQIGLTSPERPGVITPVDNQNENEDILMLLMPVMLN